LELVKTAANSSAEFNSGAEYRKVSPQGKIPAFEGANGYTLTEAIAIAIYGML
jgi:elongation factor 1-gamma